MGKTIVVVLLSLILGFVLPQKTSAALLTIEKSGNISWNVLSLSDTNGLEIPKRSSLEVKGPESGGGADAKLALIKTGEDMKLLVSSSSGNKELTVNGMTDQVVEIEERPELQRIYFGIDGGKFTIIERGVTAVTEFPINIVSKTAQVSVTTQTGERYLAIFPYEAYQSALRAKVLSEKGGTINLIENSQGILSYRISGEKRINLFDIYTLSKPITTEISAQTGEVVSVQAPIWFKIASFILT
jgi:hypothetical protein